MTRRTALLAAIAAPIVRSKSKTGPNCISRLEAVRRAIALAESEKYFVPLRPLEVCCYYACIQPAAAESKDLQLYQKWSESEYSPHHNVTWLTPDELRPTFWCVRIRSTEKEQYEYLMSRNIYVEANAGGSAFAIEQRACSQRERDKKDAKHRVTHHPSNPPVDWGPLPLIITLDGRVDEASFGAWH